MQPPLCRPCKIRGMTTAETPRSFTTVEVVELTGTTYRQIDYLARTGVLTPTIREGSHGGPAHNRLWSWEDVRIAKVIASIPRTSMRPLTVWRPLVEAMRANPDHDYIVIGAPDEVWTFADLEDAAHQTRSLPVATLVAVDVLLAAA